MIGFLVGSLIVGAVARALVPGARRLSLARTLLVGVMGSLIGAGLTFLFPIASVSVLNVLGFVLSVTAAALLLVQAQRNGLLTRRLRDQRS